MIIAFLLSQIVTLRNVFVPSLSVAFFSFFCFIFILKASKSSKTVDCIIFISISKYIFATFVQHSPVVSSKTRSSFNSFAALGLVIALRPQTPKHIKGGWSHYTDTSQPVDGGVL
jgi:hypothetical protein